MPFSKPITFRTFLTAPIEAETLMPPRQAGVYVVTRKEWDGGGNPPENDVVYVGRTTALLYRTIVLVTDAIGFTGQGKGSANSYYHSGGHNIWEAWKEKRLSRDPRTLYLSWNTDCCEACEEIKLYEQCRKNECFVGVATPPRCNISGHPIGSGK